MLVTRGGKCRNKEDLRVCVGLAEGNAGTSLLQDFIEHYKQARLRTALKGVSPASRVTKQPD